MTPSKLRVAFIHPDLGIGGAERFVVDIALGLQSLGHAVDIYTSHHDPNHCFDETRDGTLRVHHVRSPFLRSIHGKLHDARQLHLALIQFIFAQPTHNIYFVDQSMCIPLLRPNGVRVLFYCNSPDKLLTHGTFVKGANPKRDVGFLKRVYLYPTDWIEEVTTRQADTLVANSNFTARIAVVHFSSIASTPKVVYPGINVEAYRAPLDCGRHSNHIRPTLISMNRFEKKENPRLAIDAFALLCEKAPLRHVTRNIRLVLVARSLAGLTHLRPRLQGNIDTLNSLVERTRSSNLSSDVLTPLQSNSSVPTFAGTTSTDPDVLFLLNFTTAQRSALHQSDPTLALLYTATNEHFGIGPVEGMVCGLVVST